MFICCYCLGIYVFCNGKCFVIYWFIFFYNVLLWISSYYFFYFVINYWRKDFILFRKKNIFFIFLWDSWFCGVWFFCFLWIVICWIFWSNLCSYDLIFYVIDCFIIVMDNLKLLFIKLYIFLYVCCIIWCYVCYFKRKYWIIIWSCKLFINKYIDVMWCYLLGYLYKWGCLFLILVII